MINQNSLKYKSSSRKDDFSLIIQYYVSVVSCLLILATVKFQNHHEAKQAVAHYLNPMTETADQF